MEDKFLCVMAQYDEETNLKLRNIERILIDEGFTGKQTHNLPYHITLGSFDLSREAELMERVSRISKNFKSFNIKLNNIGLFGLEVLFIAPAVNKELLELQQHFNYDYADGFGWTAHTTILVDEPHSVKRALPYVAENFKSFTGRVEALSLYEFWPTRFISEKRLQD